MCLIEKLKKLYMSEEHHNPTIINTSKIKYDYSIMNDPWS